MALINCKECGQPVSDKAVKCPNCGEKVLESMEACPKCGCPNPLYNSFQKENKGKSLPKFTAKKYYIVIICIIVAALFLVLGIKGIGFLSNNNDSDYSVEENVETVFVDEDENEDENLKYALKKLEQFAKEKFYIKTDEDLRNQIDDCHFALLHAEEINITSNGATQRLVIKEYEHNKNEEWSYFPKSSKLINQIDLKLQEGCFYDNKGNKVGIVILHFLAGPGDYGQDDYLINEWDFELLTTEDVWYNGEYIRMQ